MQHKIELSAPGISLGSSLFIGSMSLVGLAGVAAFDGPAVVETVVLIVSALGVGISLLGIVTATDQDACTKYKRCHQRLAGPKPGARLG